MVWLVINGSCMTSIAVMLVIKEICANTEERIMGKIIMKVVTAILCKCMIIGPITVIMIIIMTDEDDDSY